MAKPATPIDRLITIGQGRDAKQVTVGARIVELVGTIGAKPAQAALSVGVDQPTWDSWAEQAALTIETLAATPSKRQSAHATACVKLARAVAEAEARWEMMSLAALEQLAQGYNASTTTDTTVLADNGEGSVTKRVVKSWRVAPHAGVLMWKLARLQPDRFQLLPARSSSSDAEDFTRLFEGGTDEQVEPATQD